MQKILLVGFILLISSVCCIGSSINELETNENKNYQDLSDYEQTSHVNVSTLRATISADSTPIPQNMTTTPENQVATNTQYINTIQPTNTSTPNSEIPLEGIYLLYLSATELQFNEYMSYTFGEQISEEVVVGQVLEDGNVALAGEWSENYYGIYDFCVVVLNVPKDTALNFVKGHTIFLDATVYGLIDDYGYYWDCENTLLLDYIDSH